MREWTVIGVPTSAGAHHAGQEQAPAALREAGLIERLREAGLSVADAGDLPGATFATDHDHPSARNLAAVARVARQVAGDPREIDLTGRQFLADAGVSYQEGPALAADPVGVAKRALDAVMARSDPLVVHLDVDVVDSGDLPLGNFPHYGSGVLLEHVVGCLGTLFAHESVAGLVLTEVNPTHDGDGTLIRRYLDGLISALAGG